MNRELLREGFSSYYVIKRENGNAYEEKILSGQRCKSILFFDIRRVDDESYYYFNISGCYALKQKMSNQKNSIEEYRQIYQKILDAVSEVEEYLLTPESILLESETIFFDEQKDQIQFCYVPGWKKDLMQQLLDLTEEFLEIINYEDKKLVEYLYGIHEKISKGTIPSFHSEPEIEEVLEEQILYRDTGEDQGVWEYEQEEETPFFKERAEIKQSGKWYVELGISVLISIGFLILIGYQIVLVYETGWNMDQGKIIAILSAGFVCNLCYILKKAKVKTTPEKFTTILTEEETIDKIGES